jgi:prevent-host-death family protein
MQINTERMLPITKLQKKFTQKLREISNGSEPLFVLRNNELAAVIISREEYETLKEAEEILEHLEISEIIKKRLANHDRSQNVPWEKVKKKYAL